MIRGPQMLSRVTPSLRPSLFRSVTSPHYHLQPTLKPALHPAVQPAVQPVARTKRKSAEFYSKLSRVQDLVALGLERAAELRVDNPSSAAFHDLRRSSTSSR